MIDSSEFTAYERGGRDIFLRCSADPQWRDALPCGNGLTGALWSASAGADSVILTRHDLWAGAYETGELPDLRPQLEEMRRLIDASDYRAARDVMYHALGESGYRQEISVPFPLGSISLQPDAEETLFTHYRRGIDMASGFAFAQWRCGRRRSRSRLFVSRDDDILYLRLEDDRVRWRRLALDVRKSEEPGEHPLEKELKKTVQVRVEPPFLFYSARAEGTAFGAVVMAADTDGCGADPDGKALFFSGRDCTVRVLTFAREEPEAAFLRLRRKLQAAPGWEEALGRHAALHRPMYESAQLFLADGGKVCESAEQLLGQAYETVGSPALYEKLWRFGRYLFLSGTSDNGNPFPLYGLWAGDYDLPWTQHVANENVEMIYWHAMAGGFGGSVRALIRYYASQMPAFRENARRLFGCRGIFVPGYTSPQSLGGIAASGPCVPVPVILNWISGAGWLSAHFLQYAEYAEDETFIREQVVPFVTEAARFYADYVREKDGKLELAPSVSPENTPLNLMPREPSDAMGHPCPAVRNAAMDWAVMKQTLRGALELTEQRGSVPEQERENWCRLLERIPPYQINSDGAVKEWMAPDLEDNYAHRHLSHLYPVFPGDEVRPDGDAALLRAFEKAAELRAQDSATGWSFPHAACIWARFGRSGRALGSLDRMVKSCLLPNFFTLSNDWRRMGVGLDLGGFSAVQLDALLGTVNALQEMLFRYARGTLYLFPAFPARFSGVRAEGFRIPGARLGLSSGGGELRILLKAEKALDLALVWPDGTRQRAVMAAGEERTFRNPGRK